MRRVLIGFIALMLIFAGCTKRWDEEWCGYTAPNWTSDNRIIFMRNHYIQRYEETMWIGGIEQIGGHQDIFVCEIDVGGSNFKEVGKIIDEEFERGPEYEPASTSNWGDWVVVTIEDTFPQIGPHDGRMFVLQRDGSNLKEVGRGLYADISPDQKRFVYQKFNQGLWIKNIDGSGDRQIVADGGYPAWSSEGERISYTNNELYVVDTTGNLLSSDTIVIDIPDWGPTDSNAISANHWPSGKSVIIYLDSLNHIIRVDTLLFISGWRAGIKWSPSGDNFIGHDEHGYFVIKRDGTNKWYLNP